MKTSSLLLSNRSHTGSMSIFLVLCFHIYAELLSQNNHRKDVTMKNGIPASNHFDIEKDKNLIIQILTNQPSSVNIYIYIYIYINSTLNLYIKHKTSTCKDRDSNGATLNWVRNQVLHRFRSYWKEIIFFEGVFRCHKGKSITNLFIHSEHYRLALSNQQRKRFLSN